ncbi:hypothetical protein CKO11_07795 [Rhodobacter sp. TJ_12]|uniref:peptidoglycan-binding protein n=1 Tax=Rhodobacter sp. TJ_12 TaxID=2029399 RepID=UPI001CC002D9|nr:peptidoglycan-binding protein [Rhodobacter sp. TJ_12]MBZ4022358.1 hypothetical protein [Rhodobacter sp. TJ_12]
MSDMKRPPRELFAAALVAFSLTGPVWAGQDGLREGFNALSQEERIAVQRELARADLFFAPVDGHWNSATERALRRSVETIALASGDRLHPKINNPSAASRFMSDLGARAYRRLLYGGSLFERVFFLSEDPVLDAQAALAKRRSER